MIRNYMFGSVLCLALTAFMFSQGGSCNGSKAKSNSNSNNAVKQTLNSTIQKRAEAAVGQWGGLHISMEVGDQGATIEFDCAQGRITEKIIPDETGKFVVKGVLVTEHGGPVREGEDNGQPATYTGTISGDSLTLSITLTRTNETAGSYTLTKGSQGRITRCA